jgi:hypothetical protein
MRKPCFKFPKLCLSTILIEIGIICALVAVNTRPLSYGWGTDESYSHIMTKYDADSVLIKYNFLGDEDLEPGIRVANYGWPLKSVEIASDTREIHYVHKQRLAANIAICLAIVVYSALAIEWSVRYSQRKQRSRGIFD